MRQLVLFGLFWGMGAALAAAQDLRPAEAPPGDFPGAQYIDSAGCVFDRAGRDWTAKLGDDGAPLCGFPPSRSAWAPDVVDAAPPATLQDIERDLTISLIEAEGAGIDLSAPATTGADAAPAPVTAGKGAAPATVVVAPAAIVASAAPAIPAAEHDPGIGAEITRALRAEPAIAARMTVASEPAARLCDLLGLKPAETVGLALGADPTRGYCAGQAPSALPGPQTVLATGRVDTGRVDKGQFMATANAGKAVMPQESAPAAAPKPVPAKAQVAQQSAGVAASSQTEVAVAGAARGAATPKEAEHERIAATARYVQIGQFSPDGVTATIAAIRAMGYPVARQTKPGEGGRRIILAGPFETRERLIAALDRLRKAGYTAAFAR